MRYRIEYLIDGQWIDAGSEFARFADAIGSARLAKRLAGCDCRVVDSFDRSPWATCWIV